MEEKKNSGKLILIVGVIILMLVVCLTSLYIGNNFELNWSLKTNSSGSTNDKEDDKALDVDSILVKSLYNKVKSITTVSCENFEKPFVLDKDSKRNAAFKYLASDEKLTLSFAEFNESFANQEGLVVSDGELNFKYASSALHDAYKEIFGNDDDLVDETFGNTKVHYNVYSASLKMYANIVFNAGCTFSGKYSNKLKSAEIKNSKLIITDEVTFTSDIDNDSSSSKEVLGDYQYIFEFDTDNKLYFLTELKKVD